MKDSLLDANDDNYSIVIGNPPYISSKEIPMDYKKKLKSKFISAVKQYDLFTLFIEKSIHLLRKGGYFGFIIPDSFLGISSSSKLRLSFFTTSC